MPPANLTVKVRDIPGQHIGDICAYGTATQTGEQIQLVRAKIYPPGTPSTEPLRPGPYTFGDAREATSFVTEAVEALMYLGCDIQAA